MENLLSAIRLDKEFENYVEQIPKKNKKTKKHFLESVIVTSYILFCLKNKCYIPFLEKLSDNKFNGNFDIWSWSEMGISLLAYNTSDKEKKKHLKEMLTIPLNSGNELQKIVNKNVHSRFLKGEFIFELPSTKNKNYIKDIVIHLMKMIKLSVFIDDTPIEQSLLQNAINLDINIINNHICINGIKDVF
ncbi:hypothetical protein SAMN05660772_02822 [Pasteurella testudinis DSM 23072]|uniref:Uncharacterized protein n=1 Tax=Pasteurella testudinis DSM 23072 TaxID=1122938 RepID=A0A1W1V5T4_9PAST|nr:DUF6707 family protein [Pasteurella testudinis]SMB88520.1 hypothetical protein SAMN05660772_02822 [Pasteurella testudinis DSM 23072]SUB52192.1 Uncharacterised protein [Pasteurella testudinis]